MDSLVLSDAEIIELTHYRRAAEQIRALRDMNIIAMRRHDNTICVLRSDVTHRREGTGFSNSKPVRKSAKS